MSEPVKSDQAHIDFLDPLRGLAVGAVMAFHLLGANVGWYRLPWSGWFRNCFASPGTLLLFPITYGWAGVAVFFVISGFCIHFSFCRWPDWRVFFLRRFFRIYPAYVAAVLFCALLITRVLHFHPEDPAFGMGRQIVYHLLLIQNLNDQAYYGINPAFWSIAVEVQLYLLYPLLLWLVSRVGWRRTLIGLAVLEGLLRGWLAAVSLTTDHSPPMWLIGLPFCYWFSWAVGAAIAEAQFNGRSSGFARQSLWFWTVLAGAAYVIKPLEPFAFTFFAMLTATFIARRLARTPGDRPPRTSRWYKELTVLGIWSYSLYLLHQTMLSLALLLEVAFAPRLNARLERHGFAPLPHLFYSLTFCALVMVLVLLAARLCFRYVETPSITLGKQLVRRWRPTPGPAPGGVSSS